MILRRPFITTIARKCKLQHTSLRQSSPLISCLNVIRCSGYEQQSFRFQTTSSGGVVKTTAGIGADKEITTYRFNNYRSFSSKPSQDDNSASSSSAVTSEASTKGSSETTITDDDTSKLSTSSEEAPPATKTEKNEKQSENVTEIEDENEVSEQNSNQIFPWRTNAITPLPRILDQDDLSGFSTSTSKRRRFFNYIAVGLQLGHPWYDVLFFHRWEDELCGNSAMAFRMAVSALWAQRFGVSLVNGDGDVIYDAGNDNSGVAIVNCEEDLMVKFDNRVLEKNSNEKEEEEEESNEDTSTTTTEKESSEKETTTTTTTTKRNKESELSDYINSMMDEALHKKYKPLSADETTSLFNHENYKIHFELQPLTARLESTLLLPFLTRSDIKQHPSLYQSYTKMEKKRKDPNYMSIQKEFFDDVQRMTHHDATSMTVVVDISIDCREVLHIEDRETGEVLQGNNSDCNDGDDDDNNEGVATTGQLVTHVIRMEMETTPGDRPGERNMGSWKIIDIDDQLNGNNWH